MAFTFPSSPAIGQLYDAGNAHWFWNGYAWVGGSSVSGASTSPPPPPPVPSARYPFVPRPVPGKNLNPGDPLRGDFIVGRTNVTTLKDPATATLPLGITRDLTNANITVHSAASGEVWSDYDMRNGWTIDFDINVYGFTVQHCLFDNKPKASSLAYYASIDAYNNLPQSIVVQDNDFVGIKHGAGPYEDSLAAWILVADKAVNILRNFMYYPPGDHIKTEGGLIESNFMYGGGTSPDAHFDCVQVQQLNSALTIRYNHMHGLGDGDVNGATNIIRAVPNDATQGVKTHQILCYENVMRGCGHQIEDDDSHYIAASYYTNWQGDWMYSPHQIFPGTTGLRYYNNKVLSTGVAISDVNPP